MPSFRKLRFKAQHDPFHVVLVEPEIPPNTGAIARTCGATKTPLSLVGKLGFSIDDHAVKRAGLDYWHLVDVKHHANFQEMLSTRPPQQRFHFFSANASKSYLDINFKPGDGLVFGSESVGLPPDLLAAYPENIWGIPTCGEVRSLNLSNAVSIVLYEALRQTGALSHTFLQT